MAMNSSTTTISSREHGEAEVEVAHVVGQVGAGLHGEEGDLRGLHAGLGVGHWLSLVPALPQLGMSSHLAISTAHM